MWCAFSQVEGINNGNTQQTTEMVSTLWHTGLIDKLQRMWQKLKIVQVCDFFSLFKEIKCSSHIKRWGDFLNNSTVFFLLCITKELKNIKRKCFTKSRKTTDTTIPHSEQLDHDKVKIGVQEDEEEEDDIKAYE